MGRPVVKGNIMTKIIKTWFGLKSDNRGVTALEYGMIAALIALVVVAGVTGIGTKLSTKFNSISTAISPN